MSEYSPNDFAYERSKTIDPGYAWEELLFAMIPRADTLNAWKIRAQWPEIYQEARARYNAPGGQLPDGWQPVARPYRGNETSLPLLVQRWEQEAADLEKEAARNADKHVALRQAGIANRLRQCAEQVRQALTDETIRGAAVDYIAGGGGPVDGG